MEEESEIFNNSESMLRLKHKGKLIKDCIDLYSLLARYKAVTPKSFRRKSEKSINRDFVCGLRKINKNNPVYIEMPKVVSVGNGLTRKVDAKTNTPLTNEVDVHPPAVSNNGGVVEI